LCPINFHCRRGSEQKNTEQSKGQRKGRGEGKGRRIRKIKMRQQNRNRMCASSSCLVVLNQLWQSGILTPTQEEDEDEDEEEEKKGPEKAIESGHLIKAPVIFSQLWQASTLRGIEELPQNLYNCAHIPCRMISVLLRHMLCPPAVLSMYSVHGWNGHNVVLQGLNLEPLFFTVLLLNEAASCCGGFRDL